MSGTNDQITLIICMQVNLDITNTYFKYFYQWTLSLRGKCSDRDGFLPVCDIVAF